MVWRFLITLTLSLGSLSLVGLTYSAHAVSAQPQKHLITVYDRGTKRIFITTQKTLGAALTKAHIQINARDTVEPATSQQLVASEYHVNIYRARPVVVVDGTTRIKTLSSHQTAAQIANDVGITIYPEDTTTLLPSTNFVTDGAGLVLTITRAKQITINLYGKETVIRTQDKTVGDMLKEKGIVLGSKGHVSLPLSTPITIGMSIRIWREGVQTIAVDQAIPVSTKIVYDADQLLGYRVIQNAGIPGDQSITYQINIQGGVEVSRVEIASITVRQPTVQIEVIGIKNNGSGLTKAKGSQYFTDSHGVSHRETYYDLNMSAVMEGCGQGGHYSVRPDGAKVDAQGYIIVAADYAIYPRCSMVETSLGPAKVYDTGGFVARYPEGFDLATDWSSPDGI